MQFNLKQNKLRSIWPIIIINIQVSLQSNYITHDKFGIKSLKSSNNSLQKQIMNEITSLRSLEHPNILKLYEVFKTNSTYFLVTEFIEGKNLKQLSNEVQLIQDKSILYLFKQLFKGLNYIHKNNIIHRDIKSANLILQKDGILKIIDFGLACFEGDQLKDYPKCGIPCYCAPEILHNVGNKNQYDSKVDVQKIIYQLFNINKQISNTLQITYFQKFI